MFVAIYMYIYIYIHISIYIYIYTYKCTCKYIYVYIYTYIYIYIYTCVNLSMHICIYIYIYNILIYIPGQCGWLVIEIIRSFLTALSYHSSLKPFRPAPTAYWSGRNFVHVMRRQERARRDDPRSPRFPWTKESRRTVQTHAFI